MNTNSGWAENEIGNSLIVNFGIKERKQDLGREGLFHVTALKYLKIILTQ